jgi:hypothetical protein
VRRQRLAVRPEAQHARAEQRDVAGAGRDAVLGLDRQHLVRGHRLAGAERSTPHGRSPVAAALAACGTRAR